MSKLSTAKVSTPIRNYTPKCPNWVLLVIFPPNDRRRSAVNIAAEIEEVRGQPVSAQTIRRTLHQIGVHGCHPRRKPLMKTIHQKASKQFAEDMSTKHMDYWNHILWSDEMKINLFGSDSFSCDSLVLLGPCVTRPTCIGSRCVQICSAALTLTHTGHWKFQHGTTWQRTLWGS